MSAKESIIRKKSLEMKKRKEKKRWGGTWFIIDINSELAVADTPTFRFIK